MTVITLSRQLGSLGDPIALAVADRLHLRLVGRELINRAAGKAGAPEVALAEIDELGLLDVHPSPEALRLYRAKVWEVIRELATEGNVLLVGRGSQVTLADWPETLHVRVIAPLEKRIREIETRCRVPAHVAMARIEASDRARAGYLWRQHKAQLNDPELYDLILNMGRMDTQTAIELICHTAERMAPHRRETAP